jgi:hypothetical protein
MEQKPHVVLVDVDGTVALMGKGEHGRRGPFDWDRVGEDDPNLPVIRLVRMFRREGFGTVFVSGRDEVCRDQTLMWLDHHVVAVPEHHLLMRRRKDNRPDHEVKLEIYKRHIELDFDVAYVLDDRDQVVRMWRSLGLTVLQVAEGAF